MNAVRTFYSYLWLRKDGTPYYVGKGNGTRGPYSRSHGVHAPTSKSRILLFPMESEALAFESEKVLIELFGRKDNGTGILRNLTDGGEGASGIVCSEATRKKKREVLSEHCRRLAAARVGIPLSEEHRRKVSLAGRGNSHGKGNIPWNKGRTRPEFTGYRNPFWGRSHTSSVVEVISKTWFKPGSSPWNKGVKGIPWSEARRAAQEQRKVAKRGRS